MNRPSKNNLPLAAGVEMKHELCESCMLPSLYSCVFMACVSDLPHLSLPGQGGQQVVTQIIRGQAVSTAISGASPVATVTGQGAASPTAAGQAAGQTPPGTPRAQGQGQVKLTLAQLTQLTQVSESSCAHSIAVK